MPGYLVVAKAGSGQPWVDYIVASDPSAAQQALLARWGSAAGSVSFALLSMASTGTVTPNADPSQATFTQTTDASTQAQILNAAQTALTNNHTFLNIASPTNAQVVSQVQAMARQIDGLIRVLVQDFSGTT